MFFLLTFVFSINKINFFSHIPMIYEQVQSGKFNVTDYGAYDVKDILGKYERQNGIYPKAWAKIEKTSHFAGKSVGTFRTRVAIFIKNYL